MEWSEWAGCIYSRGVSPLSESETPGAPPTIRRNREEMVWTPTTERRQQGRETVEEGGGAAQSYSVNQVALDPIKLQKNEVIKPTEHCAAQ